MTGFLNLDQLRAHAAPMDRWPDRGGAPPRPRLVAQWECASDGRPICRWRIDDSTEPEAPASARSFGRAA
jgi:hypothetical protein